jgi:hypothetical protein
MAASASAAWAVPTVQIGETVPNTVITRIIEDFPNVPSFLFRVPVIADISSNNTKLGIKNHYSKKNAQAVRLNVRPK